jgi:hypothetical protein
MDIFCTGHNFPSHPYLFGRIKLIVLLSLVSIILLHLYLPGCRENLSERFFLAVVGISTKTCLPTLYLEMEGIYGKCAGSIPCELHLKIYKWDF